MKLSTWFSRFKKQIAMVLFMLIAGGGAVKEYPALLNPTTFEAVIDAATTE